MNRSHLPTDLPYPLSWLLDTGIDVIPCQPNRKEPLFTAWQTRLADDQLRQAQATGKPFNFAARAGGQAGLVIIDCEDAATSAHIVQYLGLNGIEAYPIIRSASGAGSHLWIKCHDIPASITSYSKIAPHFGQGEVRWGSGSYALVPPSYAWSERAKAFGAYSFQKPPELFADMNPVPWLIIEAVLAVPPRSRESHAKLSELPLPLPFQPAPPLVEKHLATLERLAKSQPSKHPASARDPYASRSELEQSILTILILCGWPYPEIQRFFRQRQPAHYREQRHPERYLRLSYANAVVEIVETPIRQQLVDHFDWSHSTAWPLRTGLARQVYQFIVITAWKDARLDPVVTYPAIQRATTASFGGIAGALEYLESCGLVRRPLLPEGDPGPQRIEIAIDFQKAKHSHSGGVETIKQPSVLKKFTFKLLRFLNEAGYCTPYVYLLLGEKTLTLMELVKQAGLSRNTVATVLESLEGMGLARCEGSGWLRTDHHRAMQPEMSEAPIAVQEPLDAIDVGLLELPQQSFLAQLVMPLVDVLRPLDAYDPVKSYVRAMREIYHYQVSEERLSLRRRRQLWELAGTLDLLHRAEEIATPSPLSYIRWASRACLKLAQRRGWSVLWIDVLLSRRLLQSYVERHPFKPKSSPVKLTFLFDQ